MLRADPVETGGPEHCPHQPHRLVLHIDAEPRADEARTVQIHSGKARDDTRAREVGAGKPRRLTGQGRRQSRRDDGAKYAGTAKIGAGEIGPHDPREVEACCVQIRSRKIGADQLRAVKIGAGQDRALEIDRQAREEANHAAEFAEQSPFPSDAEIQKDVYYEVDHQTEAAKYGTYFFNT